MVRCKSLCCFSKKEGKAGEGAGLSAGSAWLREINIQKGEVFMGLWIPPVGDFQQEDIVGFR